MEEGLDAYRAFRREQGDFEALFRAHYPEIVRYLAVRLGSRDDYQVRFTLTALDGTKGAAAQVRHYRRLGACPAGWRVGDQARLGAGMGENALSGQWAGR